MRLYEFVPINDHVIDDESLIHRVFATEFCVTDDTGQLLTTAHNRNLLRRALVLIDHSGSLDNLFLEDSLHDLAARAETVSQWEYELAVRQAFNEFQPGGMENLDMAFADSRLLEA